MSIKKNHLTALGVRDADADKYLSDLNLLMQEYQIDTELRIAHFLAQVLHESVHMKTVKENLNYSEQALLRVFRKYFTPAQAKQYARKPKKIASRVYGGRMGNGDESTGDGWRYRGRGLIQLTGKSNYKKFSQWVGDDVEAQPDLVATDYAVHSAVYYWTSRDLNRYADQDDVKKITQAGNPFGDRHKFESQESPEGCPFDQDLRSAAGHTGFPAGKRAAKMGHGPSRVKRAYRRRIRRQSIS